MFQRRTGKGAWLNGEPIQVSRTSSLERSLLATEFPYDVRTSPVNNLDNYANLTKETQGVRRLGSTALDLAYVAAGRLDGFWEVVVLPWDFAAGWLLVEEAGGVVTKLDSEPDLFQASLYDCSGEPSDSRLDAFCS